MLDWMLFGITKNCIKQGTGLSDSCEYLQQYGVNSISSPSSQPHAHHHHHYSSGQANSLSNIVSSVKRLNEKIKMSKKTNTQNIHSESSDNTSPVDDGNLMEELLKLKMSSTEKKKSLEHFSHSGDSLKKIISDMFYTNYS